MSTRRPRQAHAVLLLLVGLGGCAPPGDITATSAAVVTASPAPTQPTAPALGPEAYARALVEHTNAARRAETLPELARSACAEEHAEGRVAALAGDAELTHAPLAGVISDCAGGSRAAENLSRSSASPAEVVDAWLSSPGHRRNIMDEALTALGVACVPDGTEHLCAQVFLGP